MIEVLKELHKKYPNKNIYVVPEIFDRIDVCDRPVWLLPGYFLIGDASAYIISLENNHALCFFLDDKNVRMAKELIFTTRNSNYIITDVIFHYD